ncbi:MAG: Maf family protein [Patescibacteria group bacterium]|nr:Maf family protein [Patescibacteria group bacterium]
MSKKIILASKSFRRKQLLKQMGLRFKIRESKYKEDMQACSNPYELAKFLALKKAEKVASYYDDAIIIGADTFIIYKNKFIGKPKNREDAKKMLEKFSGNEHKVVSGFAVIDIKNKIIINDFGEAKIKFKNLSDNEIEDYLNINEFLDKAGGYGLQDRATVLIESINGDFYSIVGLPINKLYCALKNIGINALKFN